MKMSDLEFLSSIAKQEFINEIGIPIPENKKALQDLINSLDDDSAPGDYKIFIRARSEASRGGYTAAQHSCSVKLKIKNLGPAQTSTKFQFQLNHTIMKKNHISTN